MNLYYLDRVINNLASKQKRTCSEQIRMCEMLQDAEVAGCKISFDKNTNHYDITGGKRRE